MPQLSRQTWYAVIAALLIAVAVAYSLTGPSASDRTDPATTSGAQNKGPAGSLAASRPGRAASDAWRVMVSDAMGLTLDAARLFELGFAGGVVIDSNTRASIEAILNSMPEDPSASDLERLDRTLRAGLPKEDADRAMQLFKDYRAYTAEMRGQLEAKGIPSNAQEANAMFDELESMKRRHFGDATATALFGQHDLHARITMEAMFVEQDTSLTPEQKKARLDGLRARLPADLQSLIPQEGSGAAGAASQAASQSS